MDWKYLTSIVAFLAAVIMPLGTANAGIYSVCSLEGKDGVGGLVGVNLGGVYVAIQRQFIELDEIP